MKNRFSLVIFGACLSFICFICIAALYPNGDRPGGQDPLDVSARKTADLLYQATEGWGTNQLRIYAAGIGFTGTVYTASIVTNYHAGELATMWVYPTNQQAVPLYITGDISVTNPIPTGANTIGSVNLVGATNQVVIASTPAPTLSQCQRWSTNIVLSSATTPVVLGTSQTFKILAITANSVGHVADTNYIYFQTQSDNGTNGIPIAPGQTFTLVVPANSYDYLSNYWIGGVVGGADITWWY